MMCHLAIHLLVNSKVSTTVFNGFLTVSLHSLPHVASSVTCLSLLPLHILVALLLSYREGVISVDASMHIVYTVQHSVVC
jgi:hypothetical protein